MHVYECGCVGVCVYVYTYVLLYIICFVHMGYFVMLWGGGGGTVVSVYSFCILFVLHFDDFLQ